MGSITFQKIIRSQQTSLLNGISIPDKAVIQTYVDSGVVAIDGSKHPEAIRHLYQLNDNHPDTYKYVWGNKETFWIFVLMAKEPFTVNPGWAYEGASDDSEGWKTKKNLICQE